MRKETAVKIITFLMVSSLLAGMLPAMLPAKGAEAEQRYTVRGTGVCEDDDSEDEAPEDEDSEDEAPEDEDSEDEDPEGEDSEDEAPEDEDLEDDDPDDDDPDDDDPDDGDSDEEGPNKEDPDGDDADKDDPDDDDSDDDDPYNEDFGDEDPDDEDLDNDIPDDENDDRDIDDGSDDRSGVRAAKGVKGQNDGDDDPDDDDDLDDDDPDDDDSKDTADVFVTITWDDQDDQDGIRPDYIRVKLLADGADSGKICDVDSLIGWTDELCDLDKYSGDHRIRYSVSVLPDEVITGTDGPGSYDYEVADVIESDNAFECEIIARHTPEVTGFEAAVQWDDDESAENTRPESITLRVRANGEKVLSLTVTKEDDWKAAFSGLAKYSGGKEIVYTLTEDVIRDYTPEITGNMKQGFTVVNHYTPGKTSVSVSKVWKDEQNFFGSRPETVSIRLLADGEDTGETIVLSGENDWTGVFAGLDANAEYTISEEIKGLNPDAQSEDMESGDLSPEDRTPEDSSPEDRTPEDSSPEDRTPEDSSPEDRTLEDSSSEDKASEDSSLEDRKPEESGPEGKKSGDLSPEDKKSGDLSSEDKKPKEKEQGDSGSEDEEPEDPEEDPGKYDDTIPGEYKAEITGDAVEGFTVTNTFLPDYRYLLKDSGTAAMSGGSGEDGNTDESDETDVSNSGKEEQDDLANTGNEISKKTGANTGDENRRLLWEQLMIMVLAAGCIHHLRAGRRG